MQYKRKIIFKRILSIIFLNILFLVLFIDLLFADNGIAHKNIINKELNTKNINFKNSNKDSKEIKNDTWWRKFKRKMHQIKIWATNKWNSMSGRSCKKSNKAVKKNN